MSVKTFSTFLHAARINYIRIYPQDIFILLTYVKHQSTYRLYLRDFPSMSVVTVTASAVVTPSLEGQVVLPKGSNKPGSMSVNLERRIRFDSYIEQ